MRTIGALKRNEIVLKNFQHISLSTGEFGVQVDIDQSGNFLIKATLICTDNEDLFDGSETESDYSRLYEPYFSDVFRGSHSLVWQYPKKLEQKVGVQRYYLVLEPYACKFIPEFISKNIKFLRAYHAPKFIELVRQSPAYLEGIGMTKADGYTIAGRTNLAFSNGESLTTSTQPAQKFDVAEVIPEIEIPDSVLNKLGTSNATVLEAVRLASIFYTKPLRIGTAGIDPTQFSELPIEARLNLIWSGESALQCAGLRNMWLDMAAGSRLVPKVRHVGAYNYYPPFEDLVPYSHALAEFWVSEWDKWVAIDPWYGFMFKKDGDFLSTTELTQLSTAEKLRVDLAPIIPQVQQYIQNIDGDKTYIIRSAKDGAPPLVSVWNNGSYHMGYMDYFNVVDFGPEMSARETPK